MMIDKDLDNWDISPEEQQEIDFYINASQEELQDLIEQAQNGSYDASKPFFQKSTTDIVEVLKTGSQTVLKPVELPMSRERILLYLNYHKHVQKLCPFLDFSKQIRKWEKELYVEERQD